MSETKEVIGTIEDKSSKEGDNWTKHSFKILKEDGRSMTLGLFTGKDDNEKKELAKQFKKGMRAKFNYYDTEKDGVIYHNINNIEALETPIEEVADASANAAANAPTFVGELDRQRLIVRQSCLSNALKYFEIAMPDSQNESLTSEMITKKAEQFEEWVWRKE